MPRQLKSGHFDFKESQTIGAWAEQHASAYFSNKTGVVRVDDVFDDETFRELDVDLIVVRPDGETWIEVKGDTHLTENVYLELFSSLRTATTGSDSCITKTAADYLFYYFVRKGEALLIPVRPLQDWIADGGVANFNRANPTNTHGRVVTKSLGVTVPIFRLVQAIPTVKVIRGLPVMEAR